MRARALGDAQGKRAVAAQRRAATPEWQRWSRCNRQARVASARARGRPPLQRQISAKLAAAQKWSRRTQGFASPRAMQMQLVGLFLAVLEMDVGTEADMDRARTSLRTRSVRRRLSRWIAWAFTATVALLTAAAILEERRLVFAVGASNGESLLAHLSNMPEFQADHLTAIAHVQHLDTTLRGAGIRLELTAPSAASTGKVVARRSIRLADGTFELRYRVDAPWLTRLMKRALAFHLVLGAAALAVLLAGTEGIMRVRLVEPLRRFAHQVRFMRSGGGWKPKLPPADAELTDLARALEELGPALDEQVQVWLEGERRAAAARALSEVRARLREPKRRALALLGDLQARALITPDAKPKVRALVLEVERISREIDGEETALFGPMRTAPGDLR